MKLDKDLTVLLQLTEDFRREMERHQELSRLFIKLAGEAAEITDDFNYFRQAGSRFNYRRKACSQL